MRGETKLNVRRRLLNDLLNFAVTAVESGQTYLDLDAKIGSEDLVASTPKQTDLRQQRAIGFCLWSQAEATTQIRLRLMERSPAGVPYHSTEVVNGFDHSFEMIDGLLRLCLYYPQNSDWDREAKKFLPTNMDSLVRYVQSLRAHLLANVSSPAGLSSRDGYFLFLHSGVLLRCIHIFAARLGSPQSAQEVLANMEFFRRSPMEDNELTSGGYGADPLPAINRELPV